MDEYESMNLSIYESFSLPIIKSILLWLRDTDDFVCVCLDSEQLSEFQKWINSLHLSIQLDFK